MFTVSEKKSETYIPRVQNISFHTRRGWRLKQNGRIKFWTPLQSLLLFIQEVND